MPGDSTDLHPSTRQVDEEEHQESGQTLARPGFDGKEVRRHDHFSLSGQEFLPRGRPLTLRRRFQTVFLQKVGDGAARHLMAQVGQRSLDSAVAPAPVLRSHADYQTLDLF